MTPAELCSRFPEFNATADEQLVAALTAAELDVSDSWGEAQRLEVVALRAASIVATSPVGRAAGLSNPKTGISTYDLQLREMYKAHACCLSRLG